MADPHDLVRADALAGLCDLAGRTALVAEAAGEVHARLLEERGARVTRLETAAEELGEETYDLVVAVDTSDALASLAAPGYPLAPVVYMRFR